MPDDTMLSAEDFAAKIKASYPDYAKVPDQELTAKILMKYPEYQSKVLPPGAAQARQALLQPQYTSPAAGREANDPKNAYMRASAPMMYGAAGGMAGQAAVSPLLPAATAAGAGVGAVSKFLLPKIVSSAGAGVGAGVGDLVRGGSLKEAGETAAVGTIAGVGMEAAGTGASVVKGKLLDLGRRGLGLTPRLTEDAVRQSVTEANAAKEAYEASAQRTSVKNAKTLLDNETKWADAQNKYKQAVADRETLLAKNKGEVMQRAQMEQANMKDGAALGDNVKTTAQNVENALTGKYQEVKQAIGGRQLAPEQVSKVFADAQEGIPLSEGDAKIVDSVIKGSMPQGGPFDAAMRQIRGEINPQVKTWGDLHEMTKNLGRAIYGVGELPPNVARVLTNTRNGALDMLQMEADKGGMGTTFADTRHAWMEMEKTFKDTTAVSSGGSPLSRMVRAQDPGFVNAQLSGKAADRAIMMLEKYKNFGANPDLARGIISRTEQAKALASRVKDIPEVKPPVRIDKSMKNIGEPPSGPEQVNPEMLKQSQLVSMQKQLSRPQPFNIDDASKSGLAGRAIDTTKKALIRRIANKAINDPEVFKELTKVTAGDKAALRKLGGNP